MATNPRNEPSYSRFACIGTGFSGIALGATLRRWYDMDDIQYFERHDKLGGTWWVNQYPGCACDIPSALYSFSFEPNAEWSRVLPPREELAEYLNKVAHKYHLVEKMRFGVNVDRCEWDEERGRWRLTIRHGNTGSTYLHDCQFLFSGTGQLVTPRELDVPGVENFKGHIFHSARWRDDVDLQGKNVVLFGNGCTAAQIVPSIVGKTKHLTQIVRSKHWIMPPVDKIIPGWLRWQLKYIPGATALQRLVTFLALENELRGFYMTAAGRMFRHSQRKVSEGYMRETAPKKYHDLLIPDFEVGCKRRIFDSGYLESLHSKNLTLINDKAVEIVPEGLRTQGGDVIPADVIVLANGFMTNSFLGGLEIMGRGGKTVEEHWDEFGGPEAYNCSAMSGFPNFFLLLGELLRIGGHPQSAKAELTLLEGPNAATGHTSAIMAAENSVNYALRMIKPLLDGKADILNVKQEAEQKYSDRLQADLLNTVWFSGCRSWYLKDTEGGKRWNAMSYPYSQAYFWYSSLFPVWSDWEFTGKIRLGSRSGRKMHVRTTFTVLAFIAGLLSLVLRYQGIEGAFVEKTLSGLLSLDSLRLTLK
ncbi:monooxygenase [Ilyonectria destructans]|nr:monooxygenase [Ilyonectria destructans]